MNNAYQIVRDFESVMAQYAGSKYAIAVDSCTNALFLCCYYLKVKEVTIPSRTYVSVPCSIIHAGGSVVFENLDWVGSYQLKPYPIFDSACKLSKNMYVSNTYQCVSFSANKILNIGKGGMIFTDNEEAYKWFKLARYEGRQETPLLEQDKFEVLGWNMYMTPEQAARGMSLKFYLKDANIINMHYPDLSSLFKPKLHI
jgi:dTDP-4-amino-4,6-dideoxygalactose transaminase